MSRFGFALLILLLTSFAYNLWKHTAHASEGTIWGEYHVGSNHSEPGYYQPKYYTSRVTNKPVQVGSTYHEYNENNTGGGLSYEVTNHIEIGAGFFKNSYHNTSIYSGADLHTDRRKRISVGISVAAVTGYKDTPENTHVMILPNVVVGNEHLRMKIGYVPGAVSLTTLTVGIGF